MVTRHSSIASLFDSHMAKQIGVKKFNQRELRLSENNSCPRKRVLRCLQYETTHPLTLDTIRNFEKGRAGELYAESILEKYFPGRIIREAIVRHPFGEPHGEGHIDTEIPGYGLIEIKTVSAEKADYGLPVEDHIVQLMSYLHFHRDPHEKRYERGEILYLVLERYGIRPVSFPVVYSPEKGAAIEALMADLWKNHVLANELPYVPVAYSSKGFPCYWEMRQDGKETVPQFCEYHGHCWNDSSAFHDLPLMVKGNEVESLFRQYAEAAERYKALSDETAVAKEAKAAMEPQLSALFNATGEKRICAGGVTINRSIVNGRVSYNMDAAFACRAVTEEALAPFAKQGAGYEKFTVKIERP